MNGLLDFIKTPEGQGLLSAAFGGLAGARRGTPLNNIGRAGIAGLTGYGSAQDRIKQEAEAADQKQMRNFQIEEIKRKQAQQQAQNEWRGKLPALMTPTLQGQTEQTKALLDQMGPDATPDDVAFMNNGARMPATGFSYAPDPQALQRHMMDPNSPFADDLIKQQLFPKADDYLTVDGIVLKKGPNGLTPVYTAPQKPEGKPTKVQEYEYAKAHGYKGTLEQYVSIGPSITAGALAGLRNAQIDSIVAKDEYTLPQPVAPRPRQSGGATVTAGGKTYTFPNSAAAAAFKKQAGIK